MERCYLEECLRKGMSLEAIGRVAHRHPSTVGYWMKRHGLTPVGRSKHSGRGGIPRERLEELLDAGLSAPKIAQALGVSPSNVHYWVRRHGLTGLRRPSTGRKQKPDRIVHECSHHGRTEWVLEGRGSYRCGKCRAEAVTKRRRLVKRSLVEEAGGRCVICGYEKYVGALQFHHLDRSRKRFALSHDGIARAMERSRSETAKCVLLCANCHAEVEGGVTALPLE
jgi:transposase-like protein